MKKEALSKVSATKLKEDNDDESCQKTADSLQSHRIVVIGLVGQILKKVQR